VPRSGGCSDKLVTEEATCSVAVWVGKSAPGGIGGGGNGGVRVGSGARERARARERVHAHERQGKILCVRMRSEIFHKMNGPRMCICKE